MMTWTTSVWCVFACLLLGGAAKPEARYLANIVDAAENNGNALELPGRGWDAWLLIMGFGSRDHIRSQECQ